VNFTEFPRVVEIINTESAEAVRACEEHGISVVHHACVLMFAEPAGWFHRAHRWVAGVTGHLPA
jgi:hypothetical protein